jgi:hypothetical protein
MNKNFIEDHLAFAEKRALLGSRVNIQEKLLSELFSKKKKIIDFNSVSKGITKKRTNPEFHFDEFCQKC